MSVQQSIRARSSSPPRRTRPARAGGEWRRAEEVLVDRLLPLNAPAIRLSEVARRLAISRASAYRLVRSGQLPGVRIGQTWRVLRADFDAFLDERRAAAERSYRQARGDG